MPLDLKYLGIPPGRRSSLPHTERCLAYILKKIGEGKIQHGQRLGEASMAKELGMDRAPVRVAFERLVAAGILERSHRSGTFLKQLSAEEYRQIYEFRAELEAYAAKLACRNATPAEIRRIRRVAEKLDARVDHLVTHAKPDWSAVLMMEFEFHLAVAGAARNTYLFETLRSKNVLQYCLPPQAARNTKATAWKTRYRNAEVRHADIADAIAAHNAPKAARLIRKHVLDAWRHSTAALEASKGA